MKRVVRDELDKLSEKLFGVKSHWNTFKKKHGLDDEQVLGVFIAMNERMTSFSAFKVELGEYLETGEKVFVHTETKQIGIPVTRQEGSKIILGVKFAKEYIVQTLDLEPATEETKKWIFSEYKLHLSEVKEDEAASLKLV